MNNKKIIKRVYNIAIVVLLLAAVSYACSRLIHWGRVEFTDDAQVWRHIAPINARVGGFVKEIRFDDYAHVHKGDTLIIIEDAEFRLALAQAEATLRGSRSGTSAVSAGMATTSRNVQVADAAIEEARVQMEHARRDYDRYAELLKNEAVTRQQFDNAKAQYDAARARYEQAQGRRQSTTSVLGEQQQRLGGQQAGVSVAEAQVNLARLNLSYTVVVAPCDGVMGRKDLHVGQLVQPGQQLARIVDDNQVWIVANYRESQMNNIKVGNEVNLRADAIPGVNFTGEVEAISAGTGSAFSPIPVDNATGNFVKVEQRVPVRIKLTEANEACNVARLLAGLNVETEVKY